MKMMIFVKKVPFSASDGVSGDLEDVSSSREDVLSGHQLTSFLDKDASFLKKDVLSRRQLTSYLNEDVSLFNKDVSLLHQLTSLFDEDVLSRHQLTSLLNKDVSSLNKDVSSEAGNGFAEPLELVKKSQKPTPPRRPCSPTPR
ncbi:MAG: hypothetical protein HZC54_02610 [Verrucomicrobia bacterium]|nr:hypothetical protein [Verrucomicrobiota bacterium]